jgi:hypothetical protein
MARYTGLEPIIDLILTELAANLPTELAAREAGPPALTLPAPVAAEYTYGQRQIHTTYPAVEIFPVITPIDKDTNDSLVTRGHVGLALFLRDTDPGLLTRKIERYGWAVIQVLVNRRAAGAFGTVGIDLNEQTLDWSPVRVADRTILETDVMFAIRATKGESRT